MASQVRLYSISISLLRQIWVPQKQNWLTLFIASSQVFPASKSHLLTRLIPRLSLERGESRERGYLFTVCIKTWRWRKPGYGASIVTLLLSGLVPRPHPLTRKLVSSPDPTLPRGNLSHSQTPPSHEETRLVPRPHPPTRKNSRVNQVKFLGLVHTLR